MAASILRAETYGILLPDWVKSPRKLADAVNKMIVPDFQPKKGVKIVTNEKTSSLSTSSIDDAAVINELIVKLEQCRNQMSPGFKMNPIQFEKVSLLSFSLSSPPPFPLLFPPPH
jgi:ubiquitin-activating enzyme E1